MANRFVPDDPLYDFQAHLQALNGLEEVWADYTGSGVTVGVYDETVDVDHPDLDDQIDLSLTPLVRDEPFLPVFKNFNHGTSVAGIIAAEANSEGVVGVAHGAALGSFSLSNDFKGKRPFTDKLFSALVDVDIANHSWGYSPDFDSIGAPEAPYFERAALEGRDGLGTINVKASGNETADANGDESNLSRHLIVVGATDYDGIELDYSNGGANLLVVAPVGLLDEEETLTTGNTFETRKSASLERFNGEEDITGLVEDPFDYTNFNGTSAAAPMVSGVVALMLEANPQLGWRDVHEILSLSPEIDPEALTSDDEAWRFNADAHVNGGGRAINEGYGYGVVDPLAAVRMAEAWSVFGEAKTSANEETTESTTATGTDTVGRGTVVREMVVTPEAALTVESVEVTVSFKAQSAFDLDLRLFSPQGTEVILFDTDAAIGADLPRRNAIEWTFTVQLLRGEEATGTWRLEAQDVFPRNNADVEIGDASLTVYGAVTSRDTVHTITDDAAALIAQTPERATLSDSDRGDDWLNLAAVTGDVDVDLRGAGGVSIDGEALFSFATDQNTRIENAVAGDGNDTLKGTGAGQTLMGMRGRDLLVGKGGDDTLIGGQGRDVFKGGAGADRFVFESGDGRDVIRDFTSGVDLIVLDDAEVALTDFQQSVRGDHLILTMGETVIRLNGQADLASDEALLV